MAVHPEESDMPIRFPCSQCSRLLQTPDEAAGKQARCPECGLVQPVPSQEGSESHEAGPAPDEYQTRGAEFGESPFGPGESPWTGDSDNPFQPSAVAYSEVIPPGGVSRYYAQSRVNGPATALLVCAVLAVLANLTFLVFFGFIFAGKIGGMPDNPAAYSNLAVYVFGAVTRVIVAVGASSMRNLKSYGLSMTAAILALIPCGSCCCLLELPLAIWALVVLNEPRVKAAFQQN
jgi:hypothetical protein